jgi:hypothetical protein
MKKVGRRCLSGGGENHQAKPGEKYSTENGRGCGRGGNFPDNVLGESLEQTK